MFPGVQLAILPSIRIGSGNVLAYNKWQTIAWTHADHDIMPTSGTNLQNNLWIVTNDSMYSSWLNSQFIS